MPTYACHSAATVTERLAVLSSHDRILMLCKHVSRDCIATSNSALNRGQQDIDIRIYIHTLTPNYTNSIQIHIIHRK